MSKQPIDALICPRFMLRVEPHVQLEEGLALAVDQGRIAAVLPRREAETKFAPAARHERPTHVLLPGLVNAHTHAALALYRGGAGGLPLEPWRSGVSPADAHWLGSELVADGTRLAVAEMLLGGVTCFSDMYFHPDIVGEVVAAAGMRAVLGIVVLDAPTAWAANADEYLRKGLEVHDRFRSEPLLTTAFAPPRTQDVADATLAHVRRLADELDVPVHTHLHETAAEVAHAVAATGRRPLARLEALGLVTPALIGVHATQLATAEIALLATAGASVVHCPRAGMRGASGACPVAALRAAGVNVALGTDGGLNGGSFDMLAEMQTAALLAAHAAGDAAALPAAAALEMATINGARALNLADEIGSLVAGKAADAICVDLADIAQRPLLDPLSQLVYSASRRDVTDVWVAGEHLVASRELTRLDVAGVAAAADRWGDRLARVQG